MSPLMGGAGTGFGFIIDSEHLDSANTELDLGGSANYRLLSLEAPDPTPKTVYAQSFDTEGGVPADEHGYENREIALKMRIVGAASEADLRAQLSALAKKVAKLNRERGTVTIVFPGASINFDVVEARGTGPAFESSFLTVFRTEATVTFVCRPFGYGEEVGNLTDSFATDTIGSGAWLVGAGGGTISVAGGVLDPSSTAVKRLVRIDRTFYDAQVTVKVTTGATVASLDVGPVTKWLADTDLLAARIGTNLAIIKRDAGSESTLASTAHTPSTATSYWVRVRQEGAKVTAEVFTSAPGPGSSPAASVSHTLTGGDLTKFGASVEGCAGLRLTPAVATETYDDFTVEPNVYYEKSLPVLVTPPIFGVQGDVPALGRLVVDEIQGASRFQVAWGSETSKNFPTVAGVPSSTRDLFTEAEGSAWTLKGGATVVTGASGASGGGSNNVVRQATLTPAYQAMLETTNAMHLGSFEVFARMFMPTSNTGQVSVAFEWGNELANRVTRNDPISFAISDPAEGQYVWRSLGLVHLTGDINNHQWVGRVIAKSTVAGDDLDIDCFWFRPTTTGGAVLSGRMFAQTSTAFSARDEFDQTAGALTGKTAPVGGVWAGAGDTDDFTVETTGKTAQRTAVSDTYPGRLVTVPVSLAAVSASVDFKATALTADQSLAQGVIVRWTNSTNYVRAYTTNGLFTSGANDVLHVVMNVAGTETELTTTASLGNVFEVTAWKTITFSVDAAGRWAVWVFPRGSASGNPLASGWRSELATGGALASGAVGIVDSAELATAVTRNYDNFRAFVPTEDVAVGANERLEIRHDGADRRVSNSWTPVSINRGKYLTVPPAGAEGRATRLSLLATRNDTETHGDPAIDDVCAQLFYTPRYL